MKLPTWITQSRKAKVAIATIAGVLVTRIGRSLGLPDADMSAIGNALQIIAGVWITGMAIENHGRPLTPSQSDDGESDLQWLKGHVYETSRPNVQPPASVSPAQPPSQGAQS